MSEKAQWLSTSSLKDWYKKYDPDLGRFYEIPTGYVKKTGDLTTEGDYDEEIISEINGPWEQGNIADHTQAQAYGAVTLQRISTANSDNPCYLLEDSGFTFKLLVLNH